MAFIHSYNIAEILNNIYFNLIFKKIEREQNPHQVYFYLMGLQQTTNYNFKLHVSNVHSSHQS